MDNIKSFILIKFLFFYRPNPQNVDTSVPNVPVHDQLQQTSKNKMQRADDSLSSISIESEDDSNLLSQVL